ncbi:hypothetical protein AAFF_G00273110 [Aldrovandia affinis]|uniref:Centrosomal protein of 44 kDa n=1 Tax=Aldrovandia affinis TaxID=143900 RepID=A0AAD7SRC7_9TELE|nr:hypothetical protein AAFF_G00273110 [Aldrovandia affinis]
MTTGDLRGCLRKLELHLRSLKYPREVDYAGLAKGDPSSFLPVVSYAFISYSSYLAEDLVGFGVELTGKNDLRFLEAVYKVLRDLFNYKPLLTKEQFLQIGFAERKITILCDVIGFVTKKHKELSKNCKPNFQTKDKPCLPWLNHRAVPADPPLESDALKPTALAAPPPKPLTNHPVGRKRKEEEEDEDEAECPTQSSASPVERRLQALEAQVLESQMRLGKLSLLECRLEQLERDMAGKIANAEHSTGSLVAIPRHRESRPSLHTGPRVRRDEPRAAGQPPRGGPDPPPSAAAINPFVLTAVPKGSVKERLDRISNMMNETSSLLRRKGPSM